jgi:molybdenum cofactor synthesis domain-containing protein
MATDEHDAEALPAAGQPRATSAALLLIGAELLSGKVRDENGWFLTKLLRRRGLRLEEIAVVADDDAAIGSALLRLIARAAVVFTSGGLGPTHDDRTLAAIAAATGRPLQRHAQMAAVLERHFLPQPEHVRAAGLRMADVPEGTELRALPGWPVLRLDLDRASLPAPPATVFGAPAARTGIARVYILPGVPALLQAKVEQLERLPDELPSGPPWHLERLRLRADETAIARDLDAVVRDYPDVEIGSYPRWSPGPEGTPRFELHLTFEGPAPAAAAVHAAALAMVARVPADAVIDGPSAESPA